MCVPIVAVPIHAIAPFGDAVEPALKNFSERHSFSLAKEPVPQVIIVANGNLKPGELAPSTLLFPNPLTP